jgi:putative ABC transport system permease protein
MNALRSALRLFYADLRTRPGWSLMLLGVLSSGLACVLYALCLISSFIIQPLPFSKPEQLFIAGLLPDGNSQPDSVPHRDMLDIQRRLRDVAEVSGWSNGTINLQFAGAPERFDGAFVTPELFSVLRTAPFLGGGFSAADAVPGAERKVAISFDVWRTRFLSDPQIIGRSIRMNGKTASIVAVMPERFSFPAKTHVWASAQTPTGDNRDADLSMQMLMRLPQLGPQNQQVAALLQVQAALNAWLQETAKQMPVGYFDGKAVTMPLAGMIVDKGLKLTLLAMLLATLGVLLVACSNAGNLLLANHLQRQNLMSLQLALGATRGRLIKEMLIHSACLSVVATTLGLVAAKLAVDATMRSFANLSDGGPPLWIRFDIDLTMVGFAMLVAVITALFCGLWPALKMRKSLQGDLRNQSRSTTGRGNVRMGGWLVVMELALSAMLLVGTFTMVQVVQGLNNFDLGVRTDRILTARVALLSERYPDDQAKLLFWQKLVQRVAQDAGVSAATVATTIPGLMGDNSTLILPGVAAGEHGLDIGITTIDENFAAVYRSTLVAGRWLGAEDRADGALVAMVDSKFVARYSKDQSVLGRTFTIRDGAAAPKAVRVVGVVSALTIDDADDTAEAVMLVPITQSVPTYATLAVHTRASPEAFKLPLAAIMKELDADTPLYWVRTFEEVTSNANFAQNFLAKIYGIIGAIALLLAAGGLYGLISFTLTQRTREIGVRRALGAPARILLSNIFRGTGVQLVLGLSVGMLLGLPFAKLLTNSIDNPTPTAWWTWPCVALVLILSALIATWVPMRRALRIDPMLALRHD